MGKEEPETLESVKQDTVLLPRTKHHLRKREQMHLPRWDTHLTLWQSRE